MKTIKSSFAKELAILGGAILVAGALSTSSIRASDLDYPINPNAPSPNAGVAPGHRAAGAFTARRPGNIPKYGPRPHSYTGVTSTTP